MNYFFSYKLLTDGSKLTVYLSILALIIGCKSNSHYTSAKVDSNPPNIIILLADDLGWKDVGYNGNTYYETPNIDALAAMGMVFIQGYAAKLAGSFQR